MDCGPGISWHSRQSGRRTVAFRGEGMRRVKEGIGDGGVLERCMAKYWQSWYLLLSGHSVSAGWKKNQLGSPTMAAFLSSSPSLLFSSGWRLLPGMWLGRLGDSHTQNNVSQQPQRNTITVLQRAEHRTKHYGECTHTHTHTRNYTHYVWLWRLRESKNIATSTHNCCSAKSSCGSMTVTMT